jgi:hypothetical protein
MTLIPVWLRGRDVASVVLTGQDIAVDGTITDGSSPAAQTVTGSLVSFEVDLSPEQDEVSPITTTRLNHVIMAENNTVRLTILLNGSGVINPLATLGGTYDVIKCAITRKRSGATTTPTSGLWTFYGVRGQILETVDSRGRNVTQITLTMVDPAIANPAYA